MEILGKAKTELTDLQASDSFLERFFIGFTDTHNFADGTHLCTQLILYALELLKCPAREFDYHIVSVRNVFVQGSVFSTWDLVQVQTGSQHRRYQCDRETGCLTCQCGGTGGSRVDLDNDDSSADRIVGKLYVGSTDDFYFFYDLICLSLQFLLYLLGDGQHRSGTERITGMYADRIDIFDKAYSNHIVFGVTDNFQLQFFPSKDGFFYQNLTYQAGLQTSGAYSFQFFYIIYQTAACSTHGVSRSQHNRISQSVSNRKRLIHAVRHIASRHLDTQTVHRLLKFNTVLATLDRIHLNADDFHTVFVQDPFFCKFRTKIQS